MRINASKTKVMSARIPGEQRQAVLLGGEPLEDVDKFKYLGSIFVANGGICLRIHYVGGILVTKKFSLDCCDMVIRRAARI